MWYAVKCWIPVDEKRLYARDTLDEAEADLDNAQLMQPENKYEIVEVDESGFTIE